MMSVYRAEVVGSLLRPAWLKDARAAWQQGRLSTPEFKRIEDRAVDAAVAQQEAIGVDVITDGELRRALFIGPLTETADGFGPTQEVIEPQRHWRTPSDPYVSEGPPQGFAVTGKLRRRRSLAAEEFTYLRARARKPAKVTLPSPLMLALLWSPKYSHIVVLEREDVVTRGAAEHLLRDRLVAAFGHPHAGIVAPAHVHGKGHPRCVRDGIEHVDSLAEESVRRNALRVVRIGARRLIDECSKLWRVDLNVSAA
jgi:hypothetical protein